MRKLGLSLLLGSMIMIPGAAFSQEQSAPTADDYVCGLTGNCPAQADEQQPAATQPSGTPRVSATRGFSLSRTTPTQTTAPRTTARATTTTRRTTRTASRTPARQVVRPAQPGRVDLMLSFGPGSSTLSAAAQTQLQAFAEALKRPQLANIRVRIEGHTDSSGGRAVNQALSQRRAQAVADYLTSQGIDVGRLEVRGFGYDQPLPGMPASARENRRVEAVRIS